MATQPRQGFVRAPSHIEAALVRGERFRASAGVGEPERAVNPSPRAEQVRILPRPSQRPKPVWSLWRRTALRALGVPYILQNLFLDRSRWSVTVTRHAIEQAGERYCEGNPAVIAAEVADAIASSRVGRRAPHLDRGAWGTARLAWTEDGSKTYVVRRAHRAWIVITALPMELAA